MPYALRKARGRDLYWVVTEATGEKHSKQPLPKEKAEAQRRALYVHMKGKGKDCGCGKGEFCVSKHQRLARTQSKLTDADLKYLAHAYAEAHPHTKKTGAALGRHMLDWCEKQMEEMDCGCGCDGMKALRTKSGGASRPKKEVPMESYTKKERKKKVRRGGKLKQCPEGFSSNGAGLCVENCHDDEKDTGVTCVQKCKPGEEDTGIECINKNCPPGYADSGVLTCIERGCGPGERDDGTACWGDLKCSGCAPGARDYFGTCWSPTDCHDGLIHHYHDTRLKTRYKKGVRGKRMESEIDLKGTLEDVANGMKDLMEGRVDLAAAFDPEKNGIGPAFRKFGADTEKAFADVGAKLGDALDPTKNGVAKGLEKLGDAIIGSIGNKDWWEKTMTNPDTYIMLISMIAGAAATMLTGGAAGPLVAMALNALGPATKMIADAARGKPIDGLDIASLALSLIPIPGASGAAGAAATAITKAAVLGTTAAKALPYVARAAQVGKIVVAGYRAASDLGLAPSPCIANCPPPPPKKPKRNVAPCDRMKMRWALNSPGEPPTWTAECPKPDCDPEDWDAETGCSTLVVNPDDPVSVCAGHIREWLKKGDEWGEEGMGETAPEGTWTASCPQPKCAYWDTDKDGKCEEEADEDTEDGPLASAAKKSCGGQVDPDEEACDLGQFTASKEWAYSQCDCDRLGGDWEAVPGWDGGVGTAGTLGICWKDESHEERYNDACEVKKKAEEEEVEKTLESIRKKQGEEAAAAAKAKKDADDLADFKTSHNGRTPAEEGQHQQDLNWIAYQDTQNKLAQGQDAFIKDPNAPKTDGDWTSFERWYATNVSSEDLEENGWQMPVPPADFYERYWLHDYDVSLKEALARWKNSRKETPKPPPSLFQPLPMPTPEPEPEVVEPEQFTASQSVAAPEEMTGEEEFQAKYGIGFDAAHAQESEYDPDSDFIRDLRRSGGKKNGGRKQMSRQMGLCESQRPGRHHIQALQRRHIAHQTVKILPAQQRPVLLREQSQAATIGTSGMGVRKGGDIPRPTNSASDWYYPTDTNFEAGAQSSGNAGSGCPYAAHF